MRILLWIVFAVGIHQLALSEVAFAADHFKLLDLNLDDQRFTGRVLAHDQQQCWLLGRDGRLKQIDVARVRDFKEAREPFRGAVAARVQDSVATRIWPGVRNPHLESLRRRGKDRIRQGIRRGFRANLSRIRACF